ncbi:cytidylate kinase-like family protein [Solirubrobacter sp. CPCC 204708]|uniref:Cytidylate kinase-like family protein n=1 Tax=Solirubrobacter deserti TaxID=2282478 RepID=A0ABT4RUK7_9ACTN|nr:cytidylate kinase-like family protein [Solirubrobacter deserti]MBE2316455.1 cytidylate kinase-like family protein [Solirubrobacter deserti]MDA0142145.1 cytidylate kinase-like family protein [Solirubrobacter deserti]
MTIVTVSAAYGAGGALVGPRLAERLGVPFLDRALPSEIAQRLAMPLDEAMARDESIGGPLARMAMRLAPIGLAFGAETAPDAVDEEAYRRTTEDVIREHAAGGDLVVLGRAAALVLRNDPRPLHVRLDGPRDRRLEQAVRLADGDRAEVEKRLDETDRAREAYVRHFYHADPRDPALYHLTIDATAVPLDTVVDIIERAATSRTR